MPDRATLSGAKFTTQHRSTSYDYISPLKLDLSGKHVLITGAAWEDGVGYAIATAFARAGASAIAVCDLHGTSPDLITKLKQSATQASRPEPKVLSYTVDISDNFSVQNMATSLSEAFKGRLDVLVNNAAHMEPYMSFLEADPETYWRTYEVNMRGLFNMSRAFLPLLLSSHSSDPSALCTLLNVSSSGALTARPGSSAYRSSKLAILGWTESLALEYGVQGLLTYCVNPGAVKTKISEGVMAEEMRSKFPDKAEVAGDTVVWLTGERREWCSGRYLSCVWDMEEVEGKKGRVVEGDLLKMRMAFE